MPGIDFPRCRRALAVVVALTTASAAAPAVRAGARAQTVTAPITFDFSGPGLDPRLVVANPNIPGVTYAVGGGALTLTQSASATSRPFGVYGIRYAAPVTGDFAATVALSRALAGPALRQFGPDFGTFGIWLSTEPVMYVINAYTYATADVLGRDISVGPVPGGSSGEIANTDPDVFLRMTRVGSTVTSSFSLDGATFTDLGTATGGQLANARWLGLTLPTEPNPIARSARFANFTIAPPGAAQVVPEPATCGLVAAGLGGVGLTARRRRLTRSF